MRRQWKQAWSMAGLVMLITLLAACGKTVTTGAASTPATTKSAPTATVTTTNGSSAIGCPAPTQTVSWPGAAPVRLTPRQRDQVTVRAGQTLEIVMPFGHRWEMTQPPSVGLLRLDTPAGYGDASLQGCVWHFAALQPGQTQSDFTITPLCANGVKCPQYIVAFSITIVVTT